MARYLGPKCRLCRREGIKLYLKGDRCFTPKCPIDRKGAVAPGSHKFRRQKPSAYGIQLREKQKLKRTYYVLEQQLKNYFKEALSTKGDTGEKLLSLLERRLDNVLYRGGLAVSRMQARQLISHGFIQVDGKKVSIASYRLNKDQVVSVSLKGLKLNIIKDAMDKKTKPPAWLNKKANSIKILHLPTRDDIGSEVNDQLIVEFYSR